MNRIIKILDSNPEQEIILCAEADDLCALCPNIQVSMCESEKKAAKYDKRCLSLCGLNDGQRISWNVFKKTIAETVIASSKLKQVCEDCCWLPLCEKVTGDIF